MAEAGSESRRAALDALRRIEKGAALDEVLGGAGGGGGLAALPGRDRAFARRLVSVTLRHRGEIDAVIERCLDRPMAGAAPRCRKTAWPTPRPSPPPRTAAWSSLKRSAPSALSPYNQAHLRPHVSQRGAF